MEQTLGTSRNMQINSKLKKHLIFHRFSMNYRAKILLIRLAINSFVPFVANVLYNRIKRS